MDTLLPQRNSTTPRNNYIKDSLYIIFVFQTSESYLEIMLEEYVQEKLTSWNLFLNASPKVIFDLNPSSFWKHSMEMQYIIFSGPCCAYSE